MIEVIKHGRGETYEGTCTHCGCQVRCAKEDVKGKNDIYVFCPDCGCSISVNRIICYDGDSFACRVTPQVFPKDFKWKRPLEDYIEQIKNVRDACGYSHRTFLWYVLVDLENDLDSLKKAQDMSLPSANTGINNSYTQHTT